MASARVATTILRLLPVFVYSSGGPCARHAYRVARMGAAPADRPRKLFLDGRADQAAPFGPGAVVVAHIRVAEQEMQDIPGVAAALADAAIGHNLLVSCDTLAAVKGAQLIGCFERAIGIPGLRPGDIR